MSRRYCSSSSSSSDATQHAAATTSMTSSSNSRNSRNNNDNDNTASNHDSIRSSGGDDASAASTASTASVPYDPWRVMGLPAGSPAKTLRSRYHALMREVHPDLCADGVGDVARMTQINRAYELLTRSPTLDTRYRNLISDRQYVYYRFLPEWMARNVDEMPRYWSWVRWRAPTSMQVCLLCVGLFFLGRLFRLAPTATTVLVVSWCLDVLLHTTLAPAALALVIMYTMMSYRSTNMGWLTSPSGLLRRELGY